jgi:hypothetical protein
LKGTENAFETIETIETIDSDRRRTSRNRVSSSARRVAPEFPTSELQSFNRVMGPRSRFSELDVLLGQ